MASPTPRANAYAKSGIINYWILDVTQVVYVSSPRLSVGVQR
ncbi:hypothetical protein [Nostoc sp.]